MLKCILDVLVMTVQTGRTGSLFNKSFNDANLPIIEHNNNDI